MSCLARRAIWVALVARARSSPVAVSEETTSTAAFLSVTTEEEQTGADTSTYSDTHSGTTATATSLSGDPAVPGYIYVRMGCISGHIIDSHDKASVDECAASCDDVPECKSFQYKADHGRDAVEEGLCVLKSSDEFQICDGSDSNYDLYVKPTTTTTSTTDFISFLKQTYTGGVQAHHDGAIISAAMGAHRSGARAVAALLALTAAYFTRS